MDIVVTKEGDVEATLTVLNTRIGQCKVWLRPNAQGDYENISPVQFPPAPEKAFVNAVHLQCEEFTVVIGLAGAVELLPQDALRFDVGAIQVQRQV